MNFIKDESAQAIIEYILILSMMLGIFFAMKKLIGGAVMQFWQYLVAQVSKGCPRCESTFGR